MILTYGDTSSLTGKPWFVLELRSERTSEEILKRIGKEAPKTFQESPLEIFIPVTSRDLDVFQLSTENYVFVRSDDPHKIAKLKHITGVVHVLCEGDTQRVNKFIPVDDDYVQSLISEAERRHMSSPATLRLGSFVRIIDGHTRDFCGEIMSIGASYACVKLDLKTKIILVETPLTNLLDISHVPVNCRVFYWSEPVAGFIRHCEDEAIAALVQDLKFEETRGTLGAVPLLDDGPTEEAPAPTPCMARTRQFTITAEIRRSLENGVTHPLDLVKITAERVRKGELKPTANLTIFWHTIRSLVFRHLKETRPDLKLAEYKQVRDIWPDYAVPMALIKELLPGIPVKTPRGQAKPAPKAKRKTAAPVVPVAAPKAAPEPRKRSKPIALPLTPEIVVSVVTPPPPPPPVEAVSPIHDFIVPEVSGKRRPSAAKIRPSFTTHLRKFMLAQPAIDISSLIVEGERICIQESIRRPKTSLTFSKAIKALIIRHLRPAYPMLTCYTMVMDIMGPAYKVTAGQVEAMVSIYPKTAAGVDPGTVYGAPVSDLVPTPAPKQAKAKEKPPVASKKSVSSNGKKSPTVETREADEVINIPTPVGVTPHVYETDAHSPLVIHVPQLSKTASMGAD